MSKADVQAEATAQGVALQDGDGKDKTVKTLEDEILAAMQSKEDADAQRHAPGESQESQSEEVGSQEGSAEEGGQPVQEEGGKEEAVAATQSPPADPTVSAETLRLAKEAEIMVALPTMTEDAVNLSLKDPTISDALKGKLKERVRQLIRESQIADAAKAVADKDAANKAKRDVAEAASKAADEARQAAQAAGTLPPPRAVPSAQVTDAVTAMATKTCSKFIGGQWRYLIKGRSITGPSQVIAALKLGGFVK